MGFIGPASGILMHLSTQKVLDRGLNSRFQQHRASRGMPISAVNAVAVLSLLSSSRTASILNCLSKILLPYHTGPL